MRTAIIWSSMVEKPMFIARLLHRLTELAACPYWQSASQGATRMNRNPLHRLVGRPSFGGQRNAVLRHQISCIGSWPEVLLIIIGTMSAASPAAAAKRILSSQVSACVAESPQTVFNGMQRHRESVMHKPNINIHRHSDVFSSALSPAPRLTRRSTGHQRAAHVAAG
ncbi:hypothetical protein [Giesbergeria sinuosa]